MENIEELKYLTQEQEIHRICLQEIWTRENKNKNISEYNIIRTDRAYGHGGTCIMINKALHTIKTITVSILSIQTTAIIVVNTIIVKVSISIALQTSSIEIKDTITKLPTTHKIIIKNITIMGDFNAHPKF